MSARYREPARTIRIIEDYRLRTEADPVKVGDAVLLGNGAPGRVVVKRLIGRTYYLVLAPQEMLNEEWMAKMYAGGFE